MDVIEKARELVGKTPYIFQGRDIRYGMDCIGMLIFVGERLGCEIKDCMPYGDLRDKLKLDSFLKDNFKKTSFIKMGSVIVIELNHGFHLAIRSGKGIIHSSKTYIIESGLPPTWVTKIQSVWDFRDIK